MSLIKIFKDYWLIALIVALGILYRFLPINQYQFSHDELSGLNRTFFSDFFQEINDGIKIDAHPALIQLFLWFWVKLFGYNEVAIKLPFLICGVLSIWYIYKFGKTFFSEQMAVTAATIVSCSFIFLVYSSYARMYITGILFSILFLQFVFQILFSETVSFKDYLGFTILGLLCAYNHHMSCLLAVSSVFLSFFYIKRNRLLTYLSFCFIAILLYLPHLPITLYQLSIGGIGSASGGWLSPPKPNELYYFIKILLGCGLTGKLNMLFFILLIGSSVFKLIPLTKKQFFLLWIFVINYSIIYFYSVYVNPILQYSVLLFSGVSLILFLCSFTSFLSKVQITFFCLGLIILFSFQSVYKKHIFSKVHVHEFEMQAKTTLEMRKRVGAEQVTSIFGAEKFFVYVYEKKYKTKFNYLSAQDSTFLNVKKFKTYLKKLKQSYIVLGGISPLHIQIIKEYFPNLVLHTEDYFSNITVLSKKPYVYQDVSIIKASTIINSDINITVNSKKKLLLYNDSLDFSISSKDETYPFNLSIPINSSTLTKNQFIVGEIVYQADSINQLQNDRFCLSVSEPNKKAVFFKAIILKEFYDPSKKIHKAHIELFAGTEYENWLSKKMNINLFIWKEKKSHYSIVNFTLKQIDYNPTKWTLWD